MLPGKKTSPPPRPKVVTVLIHSTGCGNHHTAAIFNLPALPPRRSRQGKTGFIFNLELRSTGIRPKLSKSDQIRPNPNLIFTRTPMNLPAPAPTELSTLLLNALDSASAAPEKTKETFLPQSKTGGGNKGKSRLPPKPVRDQLNQLRFVAPSICRIAGFQPAARAHNVWRSLRPLTGSLPQPPSWIAATCRPFSGMLKNKPTIPHRNPNPSSLSFRP